VTDNIKRLLSKAIVIHMCVMMAMWCADTLVASPAEARMDSCNTSSKAGSSKSNTSKTCYNRRGCHNRRGCYNRRGCHNRSSSCN